MPIVFMIPICIYCMRFLSPELKGPIEILFSDVCHLCFLPPPPPPPPSVMGKKPKNDIPNPSSISNRDVIQRLNFLYQASVYLNNIHSSSPSTPVSSSSQPVNESTSKKNEGKKSKKKRIVQLNDLSRSYIETMKSVGTKTTVQV